MGLTRRLRRAGGRCVRRMREGWGVDAYERKRFLWMLKIEMEMGDGITLAFHQVIVEYGEVLYFPMRPH